MIMMMFRPVEREVCTEEKQEECGEVEEQCSDVEEDCRLTSGWWLDRVKWNWNLFLSTIRIGFGLLSFRYDLNHPHHHDHHVDGVQGCNDREAEDSFKGSLRPEAWWLHPSTTGISHHHQHRHRHLKSFRRKINCDSAGVPWPFVVVGPTLRLEVSAKKFIYNIHIRMFTCHNFPSYKSQGNTSYAHFNWH